MDSGSRRNMPGPWSKRLPAWRGLLWGGLVFALGVAMTVGYVAESQAVPIDPALNITGSVSFDTANAVLQTGGALQTGSLASVVGGVTTASAINDVSVTGTHPLTGNPLIDLDDGFRFQLLIEGADGQANTIFQGHYALSLHNTSATDTFTVTLRVAVEHNVDANGADTFTHGKFSLQNAANNAELFLSDLCTDTVNGNTQNGQPAPGPGGTLTDNVATLIPLTLAPNATFNLQASQDLTGGAASGFYRGGLLTMITIDSAINDTALAAVPEPGSLLLAGTGVIGLLLGLKRVRSGGKAYHG